MNLLKELNAAQNAAIENKLKYIVLTSDKKDVFNFGGDLKQFSQLIRNHDRQTLTKYMKACIDVLHPGNTRHKPTRIALVNGDAMGGGFEAALCCDTIIAESHAKFAFPECLFNLFPGMGAYSFLVRRCTASTAKRLITSGKKYTAEEMLELGVIDMICEPGESHATLDKYLQDYERRGNAYNAIGRLHDFVQPLTYDELINIGYLWVDTALNLQEKDLKIMERLARSQTNLA
jgi:DSF synthase